MSFGSEPNPFAASNVPPTPMKPPGGAGDKLRGPAIALLIVAPLGLVYALVDIVFRVVNINTGVALPADMDPQFAQGVTIGIYFGIALDVAWLIGQVVVIVGAVAMLRLSSKSMAYTASVISVIPCLSACCVAGVPFGIWALIVLNDPQVRAAFRS